MSTQQNEDLCDFLEIKHEMFIKKYTGMFSLKEFFKGKNNFTLYSHIIMDVKSIEDDDNDFITSILKFQQSNASKLVLLFDDATHHKLLIKECIHHSFYNLISVSEHENFEQELLFAMDNTMSKKEAGLLISTDLDTLIVNKKPLKIAVVGSIHRIGVTTSTINLADILTRHELEVAVIEFNTSGHIQMLLESVGAYEVSGGYVHQGIHFFRGNAEVEHVFDVHIYDCGTYTTNKHYLEFLATMDKVFILKGSKVYENTSIDTKHIKTDVSVFYNFLSTDEKKFHRQYLEYCSDYFNNNINEQIYLQALYEYMKS